MKNCPVCQHALNDDALDCTHCGFSFAPILGMSVDTANARLAEQRRAYQGKGLHQGAPDFSKSPFETSEEYQQRLKGYWHVAQGELLANDYDLNTQRFPVKLHTPQPWLASAELCWPVMFSFEIERLAAKALYTQNKHYAVYAQLQHSALGVRLHDFQLYIRPGEHFALAVDELVINKRYRDNQDGTVTDLRTGLQWKRCSEGQSWNGSTCTGKAKEYTWKEAMSLRSEFAGLSDWRLPSVHDLITLVYCSNGKRLKFKENGHYEEPLDMYRGEYGCNTKVDDDYQRPTMDLQAFPNASANIHWSATPFVIPDPAWLVDVSLELGFCCHDDDLANKDDFYICVNFYNGIVVCGYNQVDLSVRLVRGQ